MDDFNSFLANEKNSEKNSDFKNDGGGSKNTDTNTNLIGLITKLATKYNGASENELLAAIVKEAEKGKRNGSLSNKELDNFGAILAPLLDGGKKAKLKKVIEQLKNI